MRPVELWLIMYVTLKFDVVHMVLKTASILKCIYQFNYLLHLKKKCFSELCKRSVTIDYLVQGISI